MWCAMANCYDSLDRKKEALQCYEKAYRCGDAESLALPRLAKLNREVGNVDTAAEYYGKLLAARKTKALHTDYIDALKFMMTYHRERHRYVEAEAMATKLLDT